MLWIGNCYAKLAKFFNKFDIFGFFFRPGELTSKCFFFLFEARCSLWYVIRLQNFVVLEVEADYFENILMKFCITVDGLQYAVLQAEQLRACLEWSKMQVR